jgi:hypothetical protein
MKIPQSKDGRLSMSFSHKVGKFFVGFEILLDKGEGPLLKIWDGDNYLAYRFSLGKRAIEKFALPLQSFIPLSLISKLLKEKDNTQALANSKTPTNEDKQDGQGV